MKKDNIIQVIILLIAALGLIYFGFKSYSKKIIDNMNTFAPGFAKDTAYFGIKVDNKQIELGNKEVKIKQAFGKPLAEKEEIVNPGAKTEEIIKHKNINYKGIEFELLNETITYINITSPKYLTTKGIKIGDDLDKLKKAYPKLEKRSEDTEDPNNCIYGFYGTGVWTMNFYLKNGRVERITIHEEMP